MDFFIGHTSKQAMAIKSNIANMKRAHNSHQTGKKHQFLQN